MDKIPTCSQQHFVKETSVDETLPGNFVYGSDEDGEPAAILSYLDVLLKRLEFYSDWTASC